MTSPTFVAPVVWRVDSTPVGDHSVLLSSPWFDIGGWRSTGRDGHGKAHSRRDANPVDGTPHTLVLPDGFVGAIDLTDRRHAPIGRILVSGVGQPDFQVRSRDFDVRLLSANEILVDRSSRAVRCYVRLPIELRASALVCIDSRTAATTRHDFPRDPGSIGTRGISLDLPTQFKGRIEVLDAAGAIVGIVQVQRLGPQPDVQGSSLRSGFQCAVRCNATMLEVSLQADKSRTLIC